MTPSVHPLIAGIAAARVPKVHYCGYLAHRMKKALATRDDNLADGQIIASVDGTEYLDASRGSRQFTTTDHNGTRYRITVEEMP